MSFHTIEYAADIVTTNGSQDGQVIGSHSNYVNNAQVIFTYDGGIPMLFYIPYGDPNREEYRHKIITHGGITTDTEPNKSAANRIILLSSFNIKNQICYRLAFVDDSIKNNGVMNLNNYKYTNDEPYDNCNNAYNQNKAMSLTTGKALDLNYDSMMKHPKQGITRTSLRFNDVKDEYILKHVRLNARLRNSHRFFDELATHDVLKGHTGNSIRSRYRNHLESKLGYVYKTDANGNLLKTPDGKHIRQSLDKLPKTLKNRFTAQDDYQLCSEIIEYSKNKYLEALKSGIVPKDNSGKPVEFDYYADFTVPVSFFSMMAKKYPTHSYNSWRDRYRKFVRNYGAQKYVDDYDTAVERGDTPEQMKNFTGKKFAANHKAIKQLIGSNYSNEESSKRERNNEALDEEIGEIKSSNIDDVITNGGATSGDINQDNSVRENSSQMMSSQEGLNLDIKYVDKNVAHDDLFNKNFYKIKPNQLPGEIEKILHACHGNNLSFLFNEFNKIGINDVFTAHILMATSADIAKIKIFVTRFLELIPFLQENEIYKGLQIEDTDGLWTEKYDNYLVSNNEGDMKRLKEVHDERSMETRKDFLGKLLQFQ